ncbi:TonB-dependent siderophore receptor [Phenylobacterium sp.]|jgi:iron complex outermembrane receptor protein|uniref:TonB-dependent siderophore receptor n=1 Tax=Phenylobacterium sp. TaxID=1871053 RepID=UPI002F4053D5
MKSATATQVVISASLAATLMAGTSALAQTAPKAAGASNFGPVLEQIVVTADRKGYGAELVQAGSFRGARTIDTPLTISVIPQQVLLSQQALGLMDALKNTAGVTSSQTSPTVYNNLSIRGIAVENRGNYRLDSSLPIVNLIDLPLEDKDRVEALKGASALYYGFTTPAGIINMTMKRPTAESFVGMRAFGDNHGGVGGHIDANTTVGLLGARINLVDAGVDSGIDKTYGHRSLIAGAFDLKPTDKLTISLDLEAIKKTVPEPGVFKLVAPKSTVANPYPDVPLPPLIDPKTNFGDKWMKNKADEVNALVHVDYKFSPAWEAIFDIGESKLHRTRRFASFTPTSLTTGEGTLAISLQNRNEYVNKNVRGEIAGAFATGPIDHELLFGASRNERTQFNSTAVAGLCPNSAGVRVTCTQNFLTPRPIPETPLGPSTGVLTGIKDVGYYVFDRMKYQEWLQVLVGVRKSDYTEDNRTTGVTTFHATPTSVSYGVVVKPRSWASLYATYIEGLESTPIAPAAAVNAGAQLPATESTQKEYGLKIEPRRGLLFQAAYFDIDRASTFINPANVYVQDGRAHYKGLELSLTGEVTPELSLYATAQILDAKQVSGAPTVISGTTVSPSSVGKFIENTPKRTYSLAGEYRLNQWVEGLSVNGGVFYTGARAINSLNQGWVPGYALVNLGVSYETDLFGHQTTFRVNADNITNKKYWVSTAGLFLAEGAPSVVKFSIGTRF